MDRRYGRTTQQGYGAAHQRERKAWADKIRAGQQVTCAKCGQPITQRQAWDLGHVPGSGKRAHRGPEHRACNRSSADERGPADPPPRRHTRW